MFTNFYKRIYIANNSATYSSGGLSLGYFQSRDNVSISEFKDIFDNKLDDTATRFNGKMSGGGDLACQALWIPTSNTVFRDVNTSTVYYDTVNEEYNTSQPANNKTIFSSSYSSDICRSYSAIGSRGNESTYATGYLYKDAVLPRTYATTNNMGTPYYGYIQLGKGDTPATADDNKLDNPLSALESDVQVSVSAMNGYLLKVKNKTQNDLVIKEIGFVLSPVTNTLNIYKENYGGIHRADYIMVLNDFNNTDVFSLQAFESAGGIIQQENDGSFIQSCPTIFILLARTVLSTPITIPAEDTKVIQWDFRLK